MELVAVEAVVDARVAVRPLIAVEAEVVEARVVMVGLIDLFAFQSGSIFAFPRGFGDGAPCAPLSIVLRVLCSSSLRPATSRCMELVAVEAVVDARVAVGPLVAVGAEDGAPCAPLSIVLRVLCSSSLRSATSRCMELVAVEAVVDACVAVGPLVAVGAEIVEARVVMVGLVVLSTFAVQSGSIFAFPRGFGDGAPCAHATAMTGATASRWVPAIAALFEGRQRTFACDS